jgi:hypothetical protein
MITESEIRDQIFEVLRNRKSINDLQFWLADKAWESEKDLALDLELLLAEYSSKTLTRTELLNRFRELTNMVVADLILPTAIPFRSNQYTTTNSPAYSAGLHALAV